MTSIVVVLSSLGVVVEHEVVQGKFSAGAVVATRDETSSEARTYRAVVLHPAPCARPPSPPSSASLDFREPGRASVVGAGDATG